MLRFGVDTDLADSWTNRLHRFPVVRNQPQLNTSELNTCDPAGGDWKLPEVGTCGTNPVQRRRHDRRSRQRIV